jgi:enamine deaminase RidA (YjgF/YER057c/UK114 family)
MNNFLSKRLLSLNFLEEFTPTNIGNYKPFIISDNLVFISGQLPLAKNKVFCKGKVGVDIDETKAKESMKIATYNLLWNLSYALEHLSNVKDIRCVNIKGYINCKDNFENHSTLLNSASDTILEVLGKENGTHTRSVIGVNSLPRNSPVEIEGIFSLVF